MKDNSAPVQDSAPVAPGVGPGSLLREARESKRLNVRAVADALHLHPDVVEALEQERFDDLPPLTFVKGYYRAYAKMVGVPQQSLMDAFDRLNLEEVEHGPSPTNGFDTQQRTSLPGWLLLAALVAAVAFAVWWFRDLGPGAEAPPAGEQTQAEQADDAARTGQSQESTNGQGQSSTAGPETTEERSPATVRDQPSAGGSSIGPGEGGDTQAEVSAPEPDPSANQGSDRAADPGAVEAPAPDTDSPTVSPEPGATVAGETAAESPSEASSDASGSADTDASAEVSAGAGQGALVLELTGKSWVDIRDATGEQLLYGLISGPATRSVSGTPPFAVTIGDVRTVQLRYQGEPVPLSRFARGDVARFQWPPDS